MYERSVCSLEESAATFSIRNGFWFHVDAASGATYLPFLEMAVHQGLFLDIFPTSFFDYRILEVPTYDAGVTALRLLVACIVLFRDPEPVI